MPPLCPRNLLDGAPHAFRVHPLPLLDVYRLARGAGGLQQIGLATEKRRYLEHIHDARGVRTLFGQVNIGEHRETRVRAHAGESVQPVHQSRAASRRNVRPVGLVEASLVNDAARDSLSEPSKMIRNAQIERVVFHDARSRNEKELTCSQKTGHRDPTADTWLIASRPSPRARLARCAAATKPAKSGCGRVGRERSSGWNWQPTNHG